MNDQKKASACAKRLEKVLQGSDESQIEKADQFFNQWLEGGSGWPDQGQNKNKEDQKGEQGQQEQSKGKDKSSKGKDKVSEADKIREMIMNMPKTVEVGSVWYIISMQWIYKWQAYVGFDDQNKDMVGKNHPGKIDNSDIIQAYALSGDNQLISTILEDKSQNHAHANI